MKALQYPSAIENRMPCMDLWSSGFTHFRGRKNISVSGEAPNGDAPHSSTKSSVSFTMCSDIVVVRRKILVEWQAGINHWNNYLILLFRNKGMKICVVYTKKELGREYNHKDNAAANTRCPINNTLNMNS